MDFDQRRACSCLKEPKTTEEFQKVRSLDTRESEFYGSFMFLQAYILESPWFCLQQYWQFVMLLVPLWPPQLCWSSKLITCSDPSSGYCHMLPRSKVIPGMPKWWCDGHLCFQNTNSWPKPSWCQMSIIFVPNTDVQSCLFMSWFEVTYPLKQSLLIPRVVTLNYNSHFDAWNSEYMG